jgi:hypothetical protein
MDQVPLSQVAKSAQEAGAHVSIRHKLKETRSMRTLLTEKDARMSPEPLWKMPESALR